MTEAFQAAVPRRFRRQRRRGRQLRPPRMSRFENRYAARIFALIDEVAEIITTELDPNLAGIIQEQQQDEITHPGVRLDDAADRIARVFRRVNVFVEETIQLPRLRQQAERTGNEINDENEDFNLENVNAVLGVKVFTTEPWLQTEMDHFVHENASLIKGLTEEQIRDIEQSVFRNVRAGASAAKIQADILDIVGRNKRRAKLIARDQVNKFNGRLSQLRQTSLGIKKYTWRTSADERVRGNPAGKYPKARPSHFIMEGVVCRWDDPTVYLKKGEWAPRTQDMPQEHPGQPIQDRCIAEPIFPDEL